MDAIEMLEQDHERVQKLFDRFEDAGDQAYKTKQGLVEEITKELRIHSELEEQIFYPAAQRGTDEEDTVREGIEEHHVVEQLLAELEGMDPEDDQYEAKAAVLIENVRHHIEEEEGELFPKVGRALGKERLAALGEEMAQLKERLQGESS